MNLSVPWKLLLTPKFHQMCVRCVSAPEQQQSWYVSILACVWASTDYGCVVFLLCRSSRHPAPSAADTPGFCFCPMTEHNAAIEHRADRAGKEVKHKYNIKTLQHLVNFRIKHSVLTSDHISLNFINKPSLCAEPGLKSTDQRFSEAAVAFDSVITARSCSLMTPAVRLCCSLKRSLNTVGRCWWTEHGANTQRSRSTTHTHPMESRG